MDNITNVEVFNLQTKNGKLVALISFQDLTKLNDENNGYNWIEAPVNIRDLQLSVRDNPLVDQSPKNYTDVVIRKNKY